MGLTEDWVYLGRGEGKTKVVPFINYFLNLLREIFFCSQTLFAMK